jgi:hypothetical protein
MRKLIVILAACALVVSFTTVSFAEIKSNAVSIYGNVRFDTFRDKVSATIANAGGRGNFDDSDTYWMGDWANSRLGINFKAGDVTGHWEWRPHAGPYATAPAVGNNTRHFYGTWNFGQGTLVVGQTWDPIFLNAACGTAGRASGTFIGSYGDLAGCLRVAQIAIWMKGFKVAFSTPTTPTITNTVGTHTADSTFPKVHVTYQFKFQPFWINLFGGYNQYKLAAIATDQEIDVKAWIYGVQVGYAAGPFFVRALYWRCQNPVEFGLFGYTGVNLTGVSNQVVVYPAVYTAATNQVTDSELVGGGVAGTYKINDMFSVGMGYFMKEGSRDGIAGAFGPENDAAAYYVNLPITLAKNVKIVPEIGKLDEKDQRTAAGIRGEDGDVEWYGAWWYIGF